MNLSPKELAGFPQGKLNELENPNKRAMYGAMGINIGNVQEAQGIKSILQNAVKSQGVQQSLPGGSIVDRMAMAVKAKVDQQKQQAMMLAQQQEKLDAIKRFRDAEQQGLSEAGGVGSLPTPGEGYAEGGIIAFEKGGQAYGELSSSKKDEPAASPIEEHWLSTLRREAGDEHKQRMAGLSDIQKPNESQTREDYTKRDIEVSQPYVDKMNALIAKMRPDAEGIRGSNRSNAIIQAGLAMMQARGGPGFAGGLAGIAGGAQQGLNKYQEGEQALQNQLQKHQGLEREGINNELGMRRDRMKYAEDAVKNEKREYDIDSREHKAAVAAAETARTNYIRTGFEAKKIDNKAITDASTAAATNRRLDIIADKGPGGGSGGTGGGSGGAGDKALEWNRRQAFVEYRKRLSDPQHPKVREFKRILGKDPKYIAADKDTKKRMMETGLSAYVAQSIEDDFGIRPYPNAAGIRSVAPAAPAAGKLPPGEYLGPLIP